jgi:ubiquinone/menaquinone biosynthesis C-methylase UbiE
MILVEPIVSRFPRLYWQWLNRKFLADRWQYRLFPQHQWLGKQIKQLKPHSILEAGCGFGRNLNFLIKEGISATNLTGADISRPLLRLARRNLPAALKLVSADIRRLPFADNQFDLVFTHGVLMHLKPKDLLPGLKEVVRVAKKNVILIEEIRSRSRQLNYFTWAHDYDRVIQELKLKVLIRNDGRYQLRYYCLDSTKNNIGG